MDRLDGKQLAEAMADFVNGGRDKQKDFIEGFCRQHRTLQQSAFKMMLELMEHIASDEYRTDGRNEDSQKIARNLVEGFKMAKKAEYISQGTSQIYADSLVDSEYGSKPSKYLGFI